MTIAEARAATRAATDFPAIEDYGLIGDCRSAALVSRWGSIDWLCWPRFDSDPVFSRLLDRDGGSFTIAPASTFETERRYVDASNSIVTRYRTPTGLLEVREGFFAASEVQKRSQLMPQAMLIRRIEVLSGEVDVAVSFRLTRGFGLAPVALRRWGAGSLTFPLDSGLVHLAADFGLGIADDGAAEAALTLGTGETATLVLSWNESGPAVFPPLADAAQLLETSDAYWRAWSERVSYDGPFADAVLRSALALKLLTFSPSGAIVAAPTTSLPEVTGGAKNWDYRYCWLRDASFTIRAFYGLGLHEEAEAFMQWLLHATHLTAPRLQVVYSVFGKDVLFEREHGDLEGYRDARPVRTGNGAHVQTQLDVYGEVMHSALFAVENGFKLSGDERSFLQRITRYVMEHWREADHGIWESRIPPRHNVHSKAMCWLALTSAARLAHEGKLKLDVARCDAVAEEIRVDVRARGFSRKLWSISSALEVDEVDSALLTLPVVGFEDARDPRLLATLAAVRRELAHEELVYRHVRGRDRHEGAFLLSSFWLVENLALAGRVDEAREYFERLVGRANDLGLYAEEIDVESGAFLGNFPQAFSHIGLINAALTLRDVERRCQQ